MISGRLLVIGIVAAALLLFTFTLVVVLRGPTVTDDYQNPRPDALQPR